MKGIEKNKREENVIRSLKIKNLVVKFIKIEKNDRKNKFMGSSYHFFGQIKND